jgi:heme/copper-type cytochrome/quinol oxidase subunit 2
VELWPSSVAHSRTQAGQAQGERFKRMGVRADRPNGALICGAVLLGLLTSGCTSDAEPQTTSPSTAVGSPTEPSSPSASTTPSPVESPTLTADYALTININIRGGKTVPNGQKINVRVGQQVILNVTSDTDDEIHAHVGGEGYELPVRAGRPARGSFTIDSPGSFEVESHHLEKIIVILNAR